MQNLGIISLNIWQILISLANLTILFLLLKKFLYKPVTKMLDERRNQIDSDYAEAANAKKSAEADKAEYAARLSNAKQKAEEIVKGAADTALLRSDKIINDARAEAEGIIRQAQVQAEQEKKRAEAEIKSQIVVVSTALTEKLLEREMNAQDHSSMIDSFIEKIGEEG